MRSILIRAIAAIAVAALVALGSPAAGVAGAAAPHAVPADGRPSFIVTLRPGTDPSSVAAEWERRGVAISHVYSHALAGFAGTMGSAVSEQLRGDARIQRVERDGPVRVNDAQTGPPWGLDRVDQRSRPLDGSYTYVNTGVGTTVYVIDTGVRPSHTDFTGRVAAGYTAIADGYGTTDCHGHGTHVAGTVAGATHGVAKKTTVVPVRVLDCKGSGTMSGVIAGVDWVTARHVAGAPAVANMSLGGPANSALDTAVRSSITDGVTYIVAAGNDNVDACTSSPARVSEAVTVAASTSSDARASYSNWGACVDLFAPGSSVTSTYHTSDAATATMSGTSMATPHVAGVAALYLSANPSALPGTVGSAIAAGSTRDVITDAAGSPNRLVYSRLTTSVPPRATAPAAPGAPTAAGARRAITVTWTAPADGGSPITSYSIRIHRAVDGATVTTASVTGTTRKTTVGGLTANTTYYATLRATNAVGSSAWSALSNKAAATR